MAYLRKEDYKAIFGLEGLKVVDTSFFINDRQNIFRISNNEAHEYLEGQQEIYDTITLFLSNGNVTFPEEVRNEFQDGISILKRVVKKKQKEAKKIYQKLRRERRLMAADLFLKRKEEFEHRNDIVLSLIDIKRKFKKGVIQKNRTESYLLGNARSYIPKIRRAIDEIVAMGDVIRNLTYNGNEESLLHKENDENIFAKTIALSYDQPVFLISQDSNFLRLHRRFYGSIKKFAESYGFDIPTYDASALFIHEEGVKVLRPEKKIIGLEKYLFDLSSSAN